MIVTIGLVADKVGCAPRPDKYRLTRNRKLAPFIAINIGVDYGSGTKRQYAKNAN